MGGVSGTYIGKTAHAFPMDGPWMDSGSPLDGTLAGRGRPPMTLFV